MAITEAKGINGTDGIFGLGPNQDDGMSLLIRMKEDGLIEKSIFSFSLSDDKDQQSYMTFGAVNETQYVGSMYDLPLVTNQWWAVEINSFSYDKASLAKYSAITKDQHLHDQPDIAIGIIDTGTNYMMIPANVLEDLIGHFNAEISLKD